MYILIVILLGLCVYQFISLSSLSKDVASLKKHLGLTPDAPAVPSVAAGAANASASTVAPLAAALASVAPPSLDVPAAVQLTPQASPAEKGVSSVIADAAPPALADTTAPGLGKLLDVIIDTATDALTESKPVEQTVLLAAPETRPGPTVTRRDLVVPEVGKVLETLAGRAKDALVAKAKETLADALKPQTVDSPSTSEDAGKAASAASGQPEPQPVAGKGEEFTLPPVVAELAGSLWALLKKNMFATVGVFLVFVGVSFLFSMLVARGMFPPVARIGSAVVLGSALMTVGRRVSKKRPDFAQVLEGGGSGILYLSGYAAMAFYSLISPTVAFAFFSLLSMFVVGLSRNQKAKPLALVGFAGAFLAPVLTLNTTGNLALVLGYGLLVNVASLTLAWRERWIEIALQAFAWSNIIGFEMYTGTPVGMPLFEQQLFLAAYVALFTAFPVVYGKNYRAGESVEAILQAVTLITTPVAFGMEAWIGGSNGLLVAALLGMGYHTIHFYQIRANANVTYRRIQAGLGVLSAVIAVAAPNYVGLEVPILLLGALTVAIYWTFPGELRVLAALPAGLAVLVGVAPPDGEKVGLLCAITFVLGAVALFQRRKFDTWMFHAVASAFLFLTGYLALGANSSGNTVAHALAATTAIGATLGLLYRRLRNDCSALVCVMGMNTLWLAGSLVYGPGTTVGITEQLMSFVASFALAGWFLGRHPDMAFFRMLLVLIGGVTGGALAFQHVPMAHTEMNILALGSWVILVLGSALTAAAIQRWIDASLQLAKESLKPILNVTGIVFLANWVTATFCDLYPGSKGLEAVWLILAAGLIVRLVNIADRRAAFSVAGTMLATYLLMMLGHQEALTLVLAVAGLLSVVFGSRCADRLLWLTGAVISGIVVVKLIAFDLSDASSIARVLSFIGSGLIFMLAGYLAPAPAKAVKP
jgi:uncharacterized membrane protein